MIAPRSTRSWASSSPTNRPPTRSGQRWIWRVSAVVSEGEFATHLGDRSASRATGSNCLRRHSPGQALVTLINADPKLPGRSPEKVPDVARLPEPQGLAVVAGSNERLRHQPAGAVELGGEAGCLIQQRTGIKDLEHLRMWEADSKPAGLAQLAQ